MEALQKIGKYLLVEEQERSELGATWRAVELKHGRIDKYYLLDEIDAKLAAAPMFLETYLSQSATVARLEHPNILKNIWANNDTGRLVALSEYQEGFSLRKILDRCRAENFPFSIDHALLVVNKLLSALIYARTNHLSHGFVNPSLVFITHEGEVKLHGLALSAALRASGERLPNSGAISDYLPLGMVQLGDEFDRQDIFGCGAILYEMLTGQAFAAGSGEPSARVSDAIMAADGEKIPGPIAKILAAAMDPKSPGAYRQIHSLAKDMEELLFSGEYSPTTFNLAFFMHSVFRGEMEELGEKIAQEKEQDFSGQDVVIPTSKAASEPFYSKELPGQAAGQAGTATVVAVPTARRAGAPKKSKMPLIIAAVAVLGLLAAGLYFFLPRGEGRGKFEEQKEMLQAEAEQLEAERLKQQQDDLIRQNDLLRLQLQQQAETERERKKQELEDEMKRMDQEIARLKAVEDKERRQRELEDQLAELEKQRETFQAEERKRLAEQQEAERIKQEQQAAAAQTDAEKGVEDTTEPGSLKEETDAPPQTEVAGGGERDSVEEAGAPVEEEVAAESVDSDNVLDVSQPLKKDLVPPREGELIPLDDQLLQHPTLQEAYQTLDVPRKALREGVVKRDRTISFLMRALIDENGRVEDVVLHRSPLAEGQSDYGMISKAEKAAKKLKFNPATKLGVRVKVWMVVSINFIGR